MSGQLEGKVALITGAVRRNGRAIAHALAREGAAIVINTRRSREEAEQVRREIEGLGRPAAVCIADITDEDAVRGMFDAVDRRFGRVDILVNNAADRGIVPFTEMTTAQWRHIVGIILDGAFYCSRAAVPSMLKNGWGRIVNLGGVSHHAPSYRGRVHVSAAKAGLEGLHAGARRGVCEAQHHRQLRGARPHRRRALRERSRAARSDDGAAGGPLRRAGGHRRSGAFSLPAGLGLHHRPHAARQRRPVPALTG